MTSLNQTLSVSAIKMGTVVDHIPAGQALKMIGLLKLADTQQQITLGLNLISKTMHKKDLIKIENKIFTEDEVDRISLLAPQASINIIEDYTVIKKISNHLPSRITKILHCLNQNCITHSESISSYFTVEEHGMNILLQCRYCEKKFDRDFIIEKL